MALSEIDLRWLCEGAVDAAVAVSDDGHIVEANGRAEALLGAARGDLLGRPLADFMSDADARLGGASEASANAATRAAVLTIEGGLSPVDCVFQRDVAPGVHRVVLRAPATLDDGSSALLRATFEGSTSAILVFDVSTGGAIVLRRANPVAERSGLLVGGIGALLARAVAAPMADGITTAYREVLRTRAPSSYEEFIEVRGAETWWLTTVTPIFDGPRVSGLVVSSLHLDFLRATEDALQRSEANFRNLIESAPDAVFVFVQRKIVYANPAAARLLGMSRVELNGMPVETLTPDAPPPASIDRNRPPRTAVYRMTRRDGVGLEVEGVTMPITYDGRQAILALARDLGARRELAARALHVEKMIAVGSLAAGLAHEINNPLAYIVGNLSFALDAFQNDAALDHLELTEALREASVGAEKVSRIVRDMQTFVLHDGDEPTAVELPRVVEASVRFVESRVRQRARLSVTIERAPSVICDEGRLRQAIANLLLNAAQAIPEGRASENEVTVRLATAPDGRASVTVQDTGVGVAEEHRGRLFEPFFTTQPRGVGLGLFFAHNVVTGFGGEILVAAETPKGSTFHILLPPAKPVRDSGTLPRVLVIDDEALVGSIVRRMLVGVAEVVAMTSAKDALATLTSGATFDAVLCDVTMPEMSGVAFFHELTSFDAALARRLVFLTGGAHTREAREFFASSDAAPLRKPFDRQQLRDAVSGAIVRR